MSQAGQVAKFVALGVFFLVCGSIWGVLKKQQLRLSYTTAELRKKIEENVNRREDLTTQFQMETARENLERRRERFSTKLREIHQDQIITIDPSGRQENLNVTF